ncbi:MAG TPA: hypothetical protein VGQ76_24505 [Thermoanaerobaculia bacterium]|jgi:chromosome segregation ATPase|nr:hypothetical protein [Thermoanaerobaculia bacterium]
MRTRLLALALLTSAIVASVLTAGERMSYIYKRGDSHYTRMSGSLDRLGPISRKYGNEFVWVSLGSRNYVIRDAATLAEVRASFKDVEAMEPSIRAIEKRMKPFEQQMEVIAKRLEALADQLGGENLSDAQRDAIERRMNDAETDMAAVERQMNGVEREMEKLEKETEKREAVAEKRFEGIVERAIRNGTAERE